MKRKINNWRENMERINVCVEKNKIYIFAVKYKINLFIK